MNLTEIRCRKCGGKLIQNGNGIYKCEYCTTTYQEDNLEKEVEMLSSILDAQKQEKLANLKRLLWKENRKEYIDSKEIIGLCNEIKMIYAEDFYANMYSSLNSENDREVSEYLINFDVKENSADVPDVISFMMKSLRPLNLLAMSDLIERAYGKDRIAYEKYMTEFEREAEKVEQGVYDVTLSRDAFIMYSSADMPKVMSLVNFLEGQGISCFVAARNLQHGKGAVANYQRALETAMDNCNAIVFVSSRKSRSLQCDVFRYEMPYVKNKDVSCAPAEYRNNYKNIPDKYKKPRVEYLIESYIGGLNAVEKRVKEFFGSLQWAQSEETVAERLLDIILTPPETEDENERIIAELREAEERRRKEAEEAEARRQKEAAEAERKAKEEAERKAKAPQNLADFEIENGVLKKYKGKGGDVVIPNSVTSIGTDAFSWCQSLYSVTISNSVTSIGNNAFYGCKSLTSVTIPNSVTSIKEWAFNGCTSLTSVTIPNSVTSIGDWAFYDCTSLTSVTIPDSVTSIKGCAFKGCTSLISVTIPDSVTSIGVYVFEGCTSLTSVTIPDSVTSIGQGAFEGCRSLTSVTLPNSVTSIGVYVFEGCTSLTSVTIGSGVTSIGERAFGRCTSLVNISVDENSTEYKSIDGNLYTKDGKQLVLYAIGKKQTYFSIPHGVTSIGSHAFDSCKSLTSVTIPNSVTSIGYSSFKSCTSLPSVIIPSSVTFIKDYAFGHWTKKQTIYFECAKPLFGLPKGFERYVFSDCKAKRVWNYKKK